MSKKEKLKELENRIQKLEDAWEVGASFDGPSIDLKESNQKKQTTKTNWFPDKHHPSCVVRDLLGGESTIQFDPTIESVENVCDFLNEIGARIILE